MDFSSGLSSILSGGEDTIAACATPAGPGALAIIRLSGRGLKAVLAEICPKLDFQKVRLAQFVSFLDERGDEIDRGIGIFFRGPASYTGEDTAELTLHGSGFLVEEILKAAEAAGARRALPGEFTRRAVANGKMDLSQAEAVDQLIRSETAWQARLAREQLHGRLSEEVAALREELLGLLAATEASLDYVEQGVIVDDEDLGLKRDACVGKLDSLLRTLVTGRKIRGGVRVVVLGAPNTGKSSLFNVLCREERAIVTSRPGTTRDLLEVEMDIEGIPVCLVDTAGLRETEDEVELEGIVRARKGAAGADLVLMVSDGQGPCEELPEDGPEQIRVRNKIDIFPVQSGDEEGIAVSALTGEGLEELRGELHRRIRRPLENLEGGVAVNPRQAKALEAAREHLFFEPDEERELVAEEIRQALEKLDEVVGRVEGEEVLDAVFDTFCLGK